MRTEKDSLGTLEIADEAYYGIQALRAAQNFPISGLRPHPTFIRAYAELKKACCKANVACGAFDEQEIATTIILVCNEIIEGKLRSEFIVDVFQAGAGTSTNMNVNEVIANRALEILGKARGDYKALSPNDHVNRSQSTNDTYPTAMRISALLQLHGRFFPVLADLRGALATKQEEFSHQVKSGRTHLQDAVPITLGQEFGAWARMMERHEDRIREAASDLSELGIGGSAAGTGLNTPEGYAQTVVKELTAQTGLPLAPSKNLFEAMQSLAPFVHLMSALKNLAIDLFKISADLRLLSSGPMTGLAEINLPAVQPGSSIMPGKVNPSILEMVSQVMNQVVGNEAAVAFASAGGQLELNVMMPGVQFNVAFTLEIMANAISVMKERCIDGITANADRMKRYAETSGSIVTALAPIIGYLESAAIAKESLATGKTIRELVLERKLMSPEALDKALDIKAMAEGIG